MPVLAFTELFSGGPAPEDDALADGREALAYWEDRAQRLPRHAVRRRREARAMAARWTAHVVEAERARYGRGAVGLMALLVSEGRLPEPARQTARRVARRARQVTLAAIALGAVLAIVAVVTVAELLARLF